MFELPERIGVRRRELFELGFESTSVCRIFKSIGGPCFSCLLSVSAESGGIECAPLRFDGAAFFSKSSRGQQRVEPLIVVGARCAAFRTESTQRQSLSRQGAHCRFESVAQSVEMW